MATEFCQRCKQSHPGRLCDYDEKGDCAETVGTEKGKSTIDGGTGSTALTEDGTSSSPKE